MLFQGNILCLLILSRQFHNSAKAEKTVLDDPESQMLDSDYSVRLTEYLRNKLNS